MATAKGEKTKREKLQPTTRAIVGPDALDNLKRRAEEIGLIIHARSKPTTGRGQKGGRKK